MNYSRLFESILIKLGDEEYQVTDRQSKVIKTWLGKKSVVQYDPAWILFKKLKKQKKAWSNAFLNILSEVYNISEEAYYRVNSKLVDLSPSDVKRIIERTLDDVPSSNEVLVPKKLRPLADLSLVINTRINIGRGELVVPFLIKNSYINTINTAYDVSVSGKNWHVKSVPSIQTAIRMGSPRGRGFSDSDIYSRIVSIDMSLGNSIKNLVDLNQTQLSVKMKEWADFEGVSVEDFKKEFNESVISTCLGSAEGVIWYIGNKLIFSRANQLECASITGNRVRVRNKS